MRRVLLIVDDWEALEVYENRLQTHFEIMTAPFGSDGMRQAEESAPDVIFVDLVFEDMTPSEALLALQSNLKTKIIPTVLVDGPGGKLENQNLPQRIVVFKRPFSFEELIRSLMQI